MPPFPWDFPSTATESHLLCGPKKPSVKSSSHVDLISWLIKLIKQDHYQYLPQQCLDGFLHVSNIHMNAGVGAFRALPWNKMLSVARFTCRWFQCSGRSLYIYRFCRRKHLTDQTLLGASMSPSAVLRADRAVWWSAASGKLLWAVRSQWWKATET